MRISDWSSDVCSSDLAHPRRLPVDLRRNALVLHVLHGRAVAVRDAVEGIVAGRADVLSAHQRVEDAGCRAHRGLDGGAAVLHAAGEVARPHRPDEHTSELHSLMRNSYAGLCLTKQIISYIRITASVSCFY